MITVNFINGRALAARGTKLGILRGILIALHLPTPFKSFTADDRWMVRPSSVSHFSFITDEEAAARRKAAEEAEEKQRKEQERRGGRVFQMPGMRIPGGH